MSDRPARVLIVDDNPQGVELLEAYLGDTDWEVESAFDGDEALAKTQSWKPDLILLDIMMPRVSGFEVCKQVKSDPATQSTAILMITALDQASDVEKAVDAGADDFLTKPIHQPELLRRARALLASRSQSGELERALAYIAAVEQGQP